MIIIGIAIKMPVFLILSGSCFFIGIAGFPQQGHTLGLNDWIFLKSMKQTFIAPSCSRLEESTAFLAVELKMP